ncbi:MAG: PH domain-containing protein [Candidatus Levybacteria bacterium]|nr:PH domain-containing protein [Candidatus Levybacteria bacterium]
MANHELTLTHLNIRQSIAILLTKLVLVDLIFAFIVVGFYYVLVLGEGFLIVDSGNTTIFLTSFGISGAIKILLSIFIVLQWLNEYYEITPENIIHKKGIIFRKTEEYRLNLVRSMDVQDTFLGEIFNFGTITLYDIRLKKYLDMYLIHNPRRYAHVLQTVRPEIEMKKGSVRLPFIKQEENGREDDEEE